MDLVDGVLGEVLDLLLEGWVDLGGGGVAQGFQAVFVAE